MKKESMRPTDSETILKDKFMMTGLVAVTGNLSPIVTNLLDMARKEFSDEVNASFTVSDLINETNGPAIFEIYRKYFTIDEDIYSVDYFLSNFVDPSGVNIDWVESKKGFLINTYNDFSEYQMNDKDFELLKTLYLALTLDKHINECYRESLQYVQPDYFTSGRKSKFYKNKKTRKLLSLEKYLYMLSDFDKKMILADAKSTYEVESVNMALYWGYRNAFSQGLTVVNDVLDELNQKDAT